MSKGGKCFHYVALIFYLSLSQVCNCWMPSVRGGSSFSFHLNAITSKSTSTNSNPSDTLIKEDSMPVNKGITIHPSPATQSAHLKLSEINDITQPSNATENILKLYELLDTTNNTILSSIATNPNTLLKYYESLNLKEDAMLYESILNSTSISQSDVQKISRLWDSEILISLTKDPFEFLSSGNSSSSKSFNATLYGHVRRMEVLFDDMKDRDKLLQFIDDASLYANTLSDTDASSTNISLFSYQFNSTYTDAQVLFNLKQVAVWFRETFPYYYDNCDNCHNKRNNSFIGYIKPNSDERSSKAGRTELYLCSCCSSVTRFPRFNLLNRVLTTRRGRCGEYSMLVRSIHTYSGIAVLIRVLNMV
jgi:hypothetical protein